MTLEDPSIVYGPAREQAIIIRKNEWGACTNIGAIRPKTARFVPGENPTGIEWKNSTGFITGQVEGGAVGAWMDITSADEGARMQLIGFYGDNNGKHGYGYKVYNPNSQSWYNFAVARDTNNTTIDSNGFIKAASPIVNIFWDGTSETNAESEGCVVTRISVGEYLIEGCTGLNADAAWGGTDGGFEIPLDRNKQPRIWLDYTVNADSFVSVRVEMPVDSLFNQKMRPTEKTPHAGEGE
ncbi:hypothetical protein WP5S18E01_26880 [Enterobacter cloacae]|nr:hypothetical protein WP5S18E01_26880 [Enterobacter cloacae]